MTKQIKLAFDRFAVKREENLPVPTTVAAPPFVMPYRVPASGETLAFCADCLEWTPMHWLPVSERGKRAETWFQCEYCGSRDLTLRYLTAEEVIRRDSQRKTGS